MSLMEFMREYPDDETCLRHLSRSAQGETPSPSKG